MKHTLRLVAAVLIVVFSFAPLFAQASDAPLTDRELAKFIADWPSVFKWLEAKGSQVDAAELKLVRARYDVLLKILETSGN